VSTTLFLLAVHFPALGQVAARAPAAETPVAPAPAPTPAVRAEDRRAPLALAVFTEGALGFADDGFYNQLVGVRLDYHAGERFTLGFATSYANLKGKEGRAHNVLAAAMLEWRFPVSRKVSFPLRFFTGYLPRNGPWLKAALGLSHSLGQRTRITFEFFAPALWVVHDSTVGSVDAALEFAVDL